MFSFPFGAAVVAAIGSGMSFGHIALAVIAVLIIILLAAGYCKAPPDKA